MPRRAASVEEMFQEALFENLIERTVEFFGDGVGRMQSVFSAPFSLCSGSRSQPTKQRAVWVQMGERAALRIHVVGFQCLLAGENYWVDDPKYLPEDQRPLYWQKLAQKRAAEGG